MPFYRVSQILVVLGVCRGAIVAHAQTEPTSVDHTSQASSVFTNPSFAAPLSDVSGWKGPLSLQNERPFQAIFLHLPAQKPEVLNAGRQGWGVQLDVANNLLIPNPNGGNVVEEDFETQRLKIEWRRGLGRGLEFGVASNLTARNGGILDGPIDFYHRLLGLPGDAEDNPQGRSSRARERTVLSFQDSNGTTFTRNGNEFGLGDTTLTLKKQLSEGRFASAGRVALKLPTGSGSKVLGSGGTDFGFVLDARYALARRVALFGNIGAFKYGSADVPNAKGSGAQGGLGVEWRLGGRESLVAQIDAQGRTVTTGNSFADRTPVIASVGYKRELSKGRVFWASFSENGDFTKYNTPALANIGPDFTLSIGYTWQR